MLKKSVFVVSVLVVLFVCFSAKAAEFGVDDFKNWPIVGNQVLTEDKAFLIAANSEEKEPRFVLFGVQLFLIGGEEKAVVMMYAFYLDGELRAYEADVETGGYKRTQITEELRKFFDGYLVDWVSGYLVKNSA